MNLIALPSVGMILGLPLACHCGAELCMEERGRGMYLIHHAGSAITEQISGSGLARMTNEGTREWLARYLDAVHSGDGP